MELAILSSPRKRSAGKGGVVYFRQWANRDSISQHHWAQSYQFSARLLAISACLALPSSLLSPNPFATRKSPLSLPYPIRVGFGWQTGGRRVGREQGARKRTWQYRKKHAGYQKRAWPQWSGSH